MDEKPTLDARSALAAQMFPKEWARANAKPYGRAKARNNLRKRAEATAKLNALRSTGAHCGSCKSFSPMPGPGNDGKMICDTHSDFHGYQLARPGGLCLSHELKERGR